jgi:pimeloyl-ACP methyl ester carboxylesterase
LRNAPVVVWGHSRSSNFAATFAAMHPDRTIAFVRYHAGDVPLAANLPILSRVPALLLQAGKDAQGTPEAAETAWKSARALGAPWTFAVEPDATHQNPADLKTANALLVPWLRAVIDQRVPRRGGALQPITVTGPTVWMGSHLTGEIAASGTFVGQKAEASWLPDAASAQGWQIVLGKRSR